MNYTEIKLTHSLAHIQFPGTLINNAVIWDAKIQTLRSIQNSNPESGIRQFINIAKTKDELKTIEIGLNVVAITRPEILKTIIMVTNYKNLCQGRHEYGEIYYFNN